MKAVMLSIQPKWCELIANGKKTIEVRKSAPKLQTPFKCYIYCTKRNKSRLVFIMKDGDENNGEIYHGKPILVKSEMGICDMFNKREKVIGEFVCDYIEESVPDFNPITQYFFNYCFYGKDGMQLEDCLSNSEKEKYGEGAPLYGWHISDLKIYDKPKELGEFKIICKEYGSDNPNCDGCKFFIDGRSYEYDESDCAFAGHAPLTRPPQSWCYCEELL